jgi:hypothetical protein
VPRGQKDWWLGPAAPLGQGMRVTANGRTSDRARNDSLIVPQVARVVLPCSVNERLRSKDVARASALECLALYGARGEGETGAGDGAEGLDPSDGEAYPALHPHSG